MNKAAITAVDLVKKFPTVLVDAKLSCDKPRPNAPPSDLCSKTNITNMTAKIMFRTITVAVSYTHLTLPTICSV